MLFVEGFGYGLGYETPEYLILPERTGTNDFVHLTGVTAERLDHFALAGDDFGGEASAVGWSDITAGDLAQPESEEREGRRARGKNIDGGACRSCRSANVGSNLMLRFLRDFHFELL